MRSIVKEIIEDTQELNRVDRALGNRVERAIGFKSKRKYTKRAPAKVTCKVTMSSSQPETSNSLTNHEGKEAARSDFLDCKADIWCWNINGINARLEKGDLQRFITEHNPEILCVLETRTDPAKIEQKGQSS